MLYPLSYGGEGLEDTWQPPPGLRRRRRYGGVAVTLHPVAG
jgi:hypothetical protein